MIEVPTSTSGVGVGIEVGTTEVVKVEEMTGREVGV